MLSIPSSVSGTLLGALPVPSLGTKLDNESLRVYDLVFLVVIEHTCGANADVF